MPVLWDKVARRASDWMEAPRDEVALYARDLDAWAPARLPKGKPWQPEEATETKVASAPFSVMPSVTFGRRPGTVPARATIEAISGRRARCLVEICGSVLPVELPLRV